LDVVDPLGWVESIAARPTVSTEVVGAGDGAALVAGPGGGGGLLDSLHPVAASSTSIMT